MVKGQLGPNVRNDKDHRKVRPSNITNYEVIFDNNRIWAKITFQEAEESKLSDETFSLRMIKRMIPKLPRSPKPITQNFLDRRLSSEFWLQSKCTIFNSNSTSAKGKI